MKRKRKVCDTLYDLNIHPNDLPFKHTFINKIFIHFSIFLAIVAWVRDERAIETSWHRHRQSVIGINECCLKWYPHQGPKSISTTINMQLNYSIAPLTFPTDGLLDSHNIWYIHGLDREWHDIPLFGLYLIRIQAERPTTPTRAEHE